MLESHTTPGGAAHSFERDGYHFESGPSFFTGLSAPESTNPIKQVRDLLGEKIETVPYEEWSTHVPEGTFISSSDRDTYHEQIRRFCSDTGYEQRLRMEARLEKLGEGISQIPIAATRGQGGRSDDGSLHRAGAPEAPRRARPAEALRVARGSGDNRPVPAQAVRLRVLLAEWHGRRWHVAGRDGLHVPRALPHEGRVADRREPSAGRRARQRPRTARQCAASRRARRQDRRRGRAHPRRQARPRR